MANEWIVLALACDMLSARDLTSFARSSIFFSLALNDSCCCLSRSWSRLCCCCNGYWSRSRICPAKAEVLLEVGHEVIVTLGDLLRKAASISRGRSRFLGQRGCVMSDCHNSGRRLFLRRRRARGLLCLEAFGHCPYVLVEPV